MTSQHAYREFTLPFQVKSKAYSIFLRDYPKDNAPTLLFIHGYGAMISHWEHNFDYFSSSYRLVACDLLGFGQSDKPDIMYSLSLWADQIRCVLEYISSSSSTQKRYVVGHSMGAASTVWYAHHDGKACDGLILVDSSGYFPRDFNSLERTLYGLVGSPIVGDVMFGLFANSFGAKMSLLPTYLDSNKVTADLIQKFADPLSTPGAKHAYLSPSKYPDSFLLSRLSQPSPFSKPVGLIWGEKDKAFPPESTLPFFKSLFPQAIETVISNSAHCPHHEVPLSFNPALEAMLHSFLQP